MSSNADDTNSGDTIANDGITSTIKARKESLKEDIKNVEDDQYKLKQDFEWRVAQLQEEASSPDCEEDLRAYNYGVLTKLYIDQYDLQTNIDEQLTRMRAAYQKYIEEEEYPTKMEMDK